MRRFPFLSGRQRLSRGFSSAFGGGCGLSSASMSQPKERGGADRSQPQSRNNDGGDGGDDGGGGDYDSGGNL